MAQRYSIVVSKEHLKFAAAHFIAFPGFREPLQGHNYQVSVAGGADLGPDGYVLEFGLVKRGREGALRGARRAHSSGA